MTTGAPPERSFFGWLDHDEREAHRMRELFATFNEKVTIDSLGLGVVRDSISDQLFPGISTVQTRARYFLFVPWICQRLEADKVAPAEFDTQLLRLEVELIESLRKREQSNQGVIGYFAGRNLQRFPSTTYWNGLGVLGLRQSGLSLADYRSTLPRLTARQGYSSRKDDGELAMALRGIWDRGLPPAPSGFPSAPVSFKLTSEESDYLVEKVIEHCPNTLIGELARNLSIPRDALTPWEITGSQLSAPVATALRHAQNFSEVMAGARALYNLLLARAAKEQLGRDMVDLEGSMIDQIGDWTKVIKNRRKSLDEWISGEEFWQFIERSAVVPDPTRRFVVDWVNRALSGPESIISDPVAASMIKEREYRLKGGLARLSETRALENWNGEPFGAGQMTFRWENAKRFLDDLQDCGST